MVLFIWFCSTESLTFLITAYDKQLAVAHKIVFREILTFVGGTIGALAMYLFRHKTSKNIIF
jgi:uncharacterized membrane protein YsdA (DUF1294 family)